MEGEPMQTLARNILAFATWILVAGTLVQVFLAGLGVFRSPTDFELHRTFGYALELWTLVLLILAIAARAGRVQIGLAALVLVLFLVQSILVGVRTTTPEIAALHPVNGSLIVLASLLLARHSWRLAGRTTL
jgi:hypothetical protein